MNGELISLPNPNPAVALKAFRSGEFAGANP
jgi:hypothetical protein